MLDLTFYKDVFIVLLLASALVLHSGAAVCGFFVKKAELSKIFNTGLTALNILLHLFLIGFMMYRGIRLDEAVLVILISVFFYTLIYFVIYALGERGKKKGGDEA